MAQILVRDLDATVVEGLKRRARGHGRSLQGEAKAILDAAATMSWEEARRVAGEWRERLGGRLASDSAELVREDRDR